MRFLTMIILTMFTLSLSAQDADMNAADKLMNSDGKLTIGGYGQIDYNQPIEKGMKNTGEIDVHRMVMLFGYNFNKRTSFVTEIEFEHVKEVYIEQAFLNYKIRPGLDFRAGLMLIPMGIINQYHESTTFNGVERPVIDSKISPTTWRESGFGFVGKSQNGIFKYQVYAVNGFLSYNDGGKLKGSSGLRKGRQKGAESLISSPNFTGRLAINGPAGIKAGLSAYYGKTQSNLFDGIDKNDNTAMLMADSSIIDVAMFGADVVYSLKGLKAKGQFYYAALGNTDQYNQFTAKDGSNNDLGSALMGYYAELSYEHACKEHGSLIPFVRFSNYNLHHKTAGELEANKGYKANVITTGLGWKMSNGTMLKGDYQLIETDAGDKSATLNFGVAVWF